MALNGFGLAIYNTKRNLNVDGYLVCWTNEFKWVCCTLQFNESIAVFIHVIAAIGVIANLHSSFDLFRENGRKFIWVNLDAKIRHQFAFPNFPKNKLSFCLAATFHLYCEQSPKIAAWLSFSQKFIWKNGYSVRFNFHANRNTNTEFLWICPKAKKIKRRGDRGRTE